MSIAENVKHETVFSIQLKKDNQAANSLVKNLHIHERFKHIDVAYHHVRDLTKNNLIQLNYIFSNEMMTNEMTKPLSKKRFKTFVAQLEMQEFQNHEDLKLIKLKNSENFKWDVLWDPLSSNESVRKWRHSTAVDEEENYCDIIA